MRPKKNFSNDLNRKRSLYFVLGLFVLLLLVYIILEWKTAHDTQGYDLGTYPNQEINKEDSSMVLETQTNQHLSDYLLHEKESKILDTTACGLKLDEEIINFPIVDEPPIFPGCENEKDKRSCFNKMTQKHFVKYLIYPEATEDTAPYFKMIVRFIIAKDGSMKQITVKAPLKGLEIAAINSIEKLPQMLPAKHNGVTTCVSFSFPISMHFKF